jgi:hypothetical protein
LSDYTHRQENRQVKIELFLAENPETLCTLGKAWNMTDEIMMESREALAIRILNLCRSFEDMRLAVFYCSRSGTYALNELITRLHSMVKEDKKLAIKALDLAFTAYWQAGHPTGCHAIQGILQLQQSL